MHRAAFTAAGVGLACGIFTAQAAMGAPSDQPANWLKKPTRDELMGVWPREALAKGVEGHAEIRCTVTVQGALRDCQIRSESPVGMGFGAAGLALTSQFLMRPARKAGVPVEDTVVIPIHFPKVDSDLASQMLNPRHDPPVGSHLRDDSPEARNAGRVVTGVPWVAAPTVTEVMAAYPARARAQKVDGRATLNCAFDRHGGLHNCDTIVEEPKGWGFSGAAKDLIGKFVGPLDDGHGQRLEGFQTQVAFTFVAASLDDPNPAIGKPHWAAVPAVEDFNAVFPAAASKAGVTKARVVLGCLVGPGGVLTACQPTSEDPPGYGLGAGAASLAGKLRLSVWTAEGLPVVGGKITAPIRWDLTPDTPAKP